MVTTDTPQTLSDWSDRLRLRGLEVLHHSHVAPVSLWVKTSDDRVLHLLARGTTVTLRAYSGEDLTGLELRSECDCAQHRAAGSTLRVMLRPGAVAGAEVVYDGREEAGWTGYEAGLLRIPQAAQVLDLLLARLGSEAAAAA